MPGEGSRMRLIVVVLAVLLVGALVAIGILVHRLKSTVPKTPDLYYFPNPDGSSLISFSQGFPDEYEKYTDNLDKHLEAYEYDLATAETVLDCQSEADKRPGFACRFPLHDLGPECISERKYGYDEGRPCVLLQMEKLIGFEDTALSNETFKKLQPDQSGVTPGNIKVTCEAVDPAGKDNMGPVEFYPPGGFNLKYLPYNEQPGYKAPLVFVQFQRLRPGVLVEVACKLWSDKIRHITEGQSTVLFSVQMD